MNINFKKTLQKELERIDNAKTAKRYEKIIEGFTDDHSPKAIINGQEYLVFNSNDYLGLRFNVKLRQSEKEASDKYGTGPGAVRFISGTLAVYNDLEKSLARFHGREEAMLFSSAFAANVAVIFCLAKGQSKDSVVGGDTLVISDALNHRSIIDGIRVANLSKEQRLIYRHGDYTDLDKILGENKGEFKRVLVITDGVFSMIGEYADIKKIGEIAKKYEMEYEEGIITIVDDSHGVAAFGETGRGVEEVIGGKCDVLVGTMGKGFGADGGYVVADKVVIDYLRESAATYIYSNSISPGVAGAALAAVRLIDMPEGKELLSRSLKNIDLFKSSMFKAGFHFSAESIHPIQPILVGDPSKTKELTNKLFDHKILVSPINYPVVPPGRDEIRVQISAIHTEEDIMQFVKACTEAGKEMGLL